MTNITNRTNVQDLFLKRFIVSVECSPYIPLSSWATIWNYLVSGMCIDRDVVGIDRKDISHEMNINFSHRNRQQLCGSLNARFWCFNQSWKWYSPSLDASQTLALSTWRSVCDIWAWILCLSFTNHLKNPLSSCWSFLFSSDQWNWSYIQDHVASPLLSYIDE